MGTRTAAAPTVRVGIPGPLRELTGDAEVEATGATVGAALDDLVTRYPGLRRHLRTEQGALREHVNVFLGADDVRSLDGEATAVSPGAEITLVPSIAGG